MRVLIARLRGLCAGGDACAAGGDADGAARAFLLAAALLERAPALWGAADGNGSKGTADGPAAAAAVPCGLRVYVHHRLAALAQMEPKAAMPLALEAEAAARLGGAAFEAAVAALNVAAPPPPPRTKWTRRVPHPVLIGHAAQVAACLARLGEHDAAFARAKEAARFARALDEDANANEDPARRAGMARVLAGACQIMSLAHAFRGNAGTALRLARVALENAAPAGMDASADAAAFALLTRTYEIALTLNELVGAVQPARAADVGAGARRRAASRGGADADAGAGAGADARWRRRLPVQTVHAPYCCPYPCPYCTLPLLTTTSPPHPPRPTVAPTRVPTVHSLC
jgi:hypothetical protein